MENEVRLIDANALHKILEEEQDGTRRIYSSLVDYRDKEVCKGELGNYARVKRIVEEAPTIDPESLRPKGRWEEHRDEYEICATEFTCSICKESFCNSELIDEDFHKLMKYCPNCGAKTEG